MQIGLTTSVIQRGRSGVGQHVLALVRALLPHAARHEFTLFVLEDDLPLFSFASQAMRIVRVPEAMRAPVRDILWHQLQLPRLARQLGLDVLHVPSYRRLVASARCATVGTIHDLAPFRLAGKYDWRRMLYGRAVVKHLARRQDAVITVSGHTAVDVRHFFGVRSERIHVIHNGLDHARFHTDESAAARVAARWGLHRPFFLYVSRLEHPAKNHVRLIEAFERFKRTTGSDWQLVLGGGDWHGAGIIRQRARESRDAADIRLPGFVADAELPDLYRAAAAMAYPSLFEGFGMPPVEAMACGCPVICSTRGALGEVVADAACIVNPEDSADIARALGEIAGRPGLRATLRDAGLAHARRFAWSAAAAKTMAVYEHAHLSRHRATEPAMHLPR